MKQLMYLLVVLILLAFAVPAIACDNCTTDQIMAVVDMSADNVDLATTTKMRFYDPTEAAYMKGSTSTVAVIFTYVFTTEQRSRHVLTSIGVLVAEWPDAMRPDGGGRLLLRQSGNLVLG